MLLPYSSEWVAKSKTVVGRWRHQQEQHWPFPKRMGPSRILTVEGVVRKALRIGCSVESAIHVRMQGMTDNTLAGAPGSHAQSNVD